MLTITNSFLLLGLLRLCQFWSKSIKKCGRECGHRRTDERDVRLPDCLTLAMVNCDHIVQKVEMANERIVRFLS